MKTIVSVLTAGAILSAGGFQAMAAQKSAHVIQTPHAAQWDPRHRCLRPALRLR